MFSLEIGKSFKHKGEEFQIIKIYRDCFLATDEFMTTIKRFPILQRIKWGEKMNMFGINLSKSIYEDFYLLNIYDLDGLSESIKLDKDKAEEIKEKFDLDLLEIQF